MSCAKKFETNVKHLDGVLDAKVNFTASKLTVIGTAEIHKIEKAGAFENLKVRPDHLEEESKAPIWKRHWNVFISALLLLTGWMIRLMNGNESILSNGFYAGAILLGGYGLFRTGVKNLMRLEFDMRTLMTIAIIGAALIGEWGEGAMVVILFAVSEILEIYSMDKARQSIRGLMEIAPKEATVRRNAIEMTIPVDEVQVGDTMLILPGQKLAMDGIILKGSSYVNQSAITGESVPVHLSVGDEAFAGTLNEDGYLEVEVTKRVEDTTLAKIIHLVEKAQEERAPSQSFVDLFAKYYTPAIILVAAGVAIIPPLSGGSWSEWVYQGLAVLVVGCPCALVISTPVSIVTAVGNAARNGVLVKGGVYLEEAGKLKSIAFDKTGTLTKGIPEVTDIISLSGYRVPEIIRIAAALESHSQHPLASAILKKAEQNGERKIVEEVENFRSITGKGIKGEINKTVFYAGSLVLFTDELQLTLQEETIEIISRLRNEGKTVLAIGTEESVIAIIAAADTIRDESADVVKALHDLNIKNTIMLTGDHQLTAKSIAEIMGISTVKSELLPEEKLNYIKAYEQRYGKVAMVGDGINDAPALAASTVGIAMGGAGTDTAIETADIALMGDDLRKLPYTIKLSRKTLAIIKQNIAFSLGLKLLALLLVIPGWLTLWIAIFADMGATLLVTLNGLRLMKVKE